MSEGCERDKRKLCEKINRNLCEILVHSVLLRAYLGA